METLAKNLCLILGYPPTPHVRTKSDSTASLIYLKNMLTVIPFSSQLPPSHHHLQCSGWRVPRVLSLPPIPPNFQYPPHPCIHTCPTTPPPILQHGNVFIGNRIFPSMPCLLFLSSSSGCLPHKVGIWLSTPSWSLPPTFQTPIRDPANYFWSHCIQYVSWDQTF